MSVPFTVGDLRKGLESFSDETPAVVTVDGQRYDWLEILSVKSQYLCGTDRGEWKPYCELSVQQKSE